MSAVRRRAGSVDLLAGGLAGGSPGVGALVETAPVGVIATGGSGTADCMDMVLLVVEFAMEAATRSENRMVVGNEYALTTRRVQPSVSMT
jgi:hypothetical protein